VAAFLPSGAVVVDVSEVDTDGDGVTELLVIYTIDGIGRGLVIRRELQRGRAYDLGGSAPAGTGPQALPTAVPQAGSLPPAELFRENWGENTVADVNGDGKIEIVVEGTVGGSSETVSVFQWNGSGYVPLLTLSGAEGVAMDDVQKNGNLEFTALQLLFQRSAVMQGTHAAWRDGAYRQWGDIRFLFGPPVRFNYPEEVALAYYGYWGQGQPEKMYGLLAEPQRSQTSLDMLAEQARAVASVAVAALSVSDEQEASATVTLEARLLARAAQAEATEKQIWRVVKVDGQWRLAERIQP
jgi:hypothetical protein